MKKTALCGVALVLALCATLGTGVSRAAASSGFRCNQTLTGVTITGNLFVPEGGTCDLVGSTVTGDASVDTHGGLSADQASDIAGTVHVGRNAQFAEFNGSSVGHDVECRHCAVAFILSSSVGGNLIDEATSEGSIIKNSRIGGNLQISDSYDTFHDAVAFDIETNAIGGRFAFDDNRGGSSFLNNVVTGTLSCAGNHPPPTGSGNTASQKRGQCASL